MAKSSRKFQFGGRQATLTLVALAIMVAGALFARFGLVPYLASSEGTPDTPPAILIDPTWKPVAERILVGIALVGMAAGFGVGFYQWWRKRLSVDTAEHLHVQAGLGLPFGCSLVLLQVEGRPYLAGLDPTGIKSFLPLPAPQATREPTDSFASSNQVPAILEVRA